MSDTTPAQEPALKPEELLPCPFCGCASVYQGSNRPVDDLVWVACNNDDCGAGIFAVDAPKAWNTRTVPPAAAPVTGDREQGLGVLISAAEAVREHLALAWSIPSGCLKHDVPPCNAVPVDKLHALKMALDIFKRVQA